MNLKVQLSAALGALPPLSSGHEVVDLSDAGKRLVCELSALDAVGCAFDRLCVSTDRLAQTTVEQLKKISADLSRRLTYLLEPVALLEVDADRCSLQMRSSPPHKDDDGTRYYELLVERGGQVSLCRYQKQPGQPRQRVSAHVTREVLLRLADDLAAAAG